MLDYNRISDKWANSEGVEATFDNWAGAAPTTGDSCSATEKGLNGQSGANGLASMDCSGAELMICMCPGEPYVCLDICGLLRTSSKTIVVVIQ